MDFRTVICIVCFLASLVIFALYAQLCKEHKRDTDLLVAYIQRLTDMADLYDKQHSELVLIKDFISAQVDVMKNDTENNKQLLAMLIKIDQFMKEGK